MQRECSGEGTWNIGGVDFVQCTGQNLLLEDQPKALVEETVEDEVC